MHLNQIYLFCLLNLIIVNNFILAEKITIANYHDLHNFETFASSSAKYSSASKTMMFSQEKDRILLDQLQRFLTKFNYRILADLLSLTTDKCSQDFNYIFESLPIEWAIKSNYVLIVLLLFLYTVSFYFTTT